jgi:hypothetical protein
MVSRVPQRLTRRAKKSLAVGYCHTSLLMLGRSAEFPGRLAAPVLLEKARPLVEASLSIATLQFPAGRSLNWRPCGFVTVTVQLLMMVTA